MNPIENGMKWMLDLLRIQNEVLITAIFMKVVKFRPEFTRRRVNISILYRLYNIFFKGGGLLCIIKQNLSERDLSREWICMKALK